MKILLITLLSIFGLICIVISLSILILNKNKNGRLYDFVKRHIITDEDLEKLP